MTTQEMTIDVSDLAEGFGLHPDEVLALIRSGKIAGRLYAGQDEDAETYACVFFHANQRLTLVVDETGALLRRSKVNFGDHPLPQSMHRGPDAEQKKQVQRRSS
uniref:DUF6522 family protein n=1 Tax=Stappia sp. TaxID=1870903 RepID=UPI003BAA51C3